jgi:hypothetical protein
MAGECHAVCIPKGDNIRTRSPSLRHNAHFPECAGHFGVRACEGALVSSYPAFGPDPER